MGSLTGIRVSILESRRRNELARLIEGHGGKVHSVPAVRESPIQLNEDIARFIDELQRGHYQIVVFQTGVAVNNLFSQAESLGTAKALKVGLQSTTVVCRGPKPLGALRKLGVTGCIGIEEPYTTAELEQALVQLSLMGKRIAVFNYGESNVSLVEALSKGGALVDELWLYRWELPRDTRFLDQLIMETMFGIVDVMLFTSQVQVRHLFEVADQYGRSRLKLSDALNTHVVVAAVGPTCAEALRHFDVLPDVVPVHPKMGHMVNDLVAYVEKHNKATVQLCT